MTAPHHNDSSACRHLHLESIDNIRDLGGLRTVDNPSTRFNTLFRSSAINDVTAAEVDTLLQRVNLRTIIDLRTIREVEHHRRGLLAGRVSVYFNIPILAPNDQRDQLLPIADTADLTALYLGYVHASGPQIATAIRILANRAHLPALFHCAAGKDRTGLLTAVILDAIGVLEEDIVADYILTAPNMDRLLARLGRSDVYRDAVARARPSAVAAEADTMHRVLGQLRNQHGGAANWLQANGLEPDVLTMLSANLLE